MLGQRLEQLVTNAQPGNIKSGYATGAKSKGSANEIPPDHDKVIKQPARREAGGRGGDRVRRVGS